MSTTAPASSRRKAALGFIFALTTIDVLAMGVLTPVLAPLIVELTGSTVTGAEVFGILVMLGGLMQFFFSPLLGILSDRFGRRPVLVLSAFGLAIDFAIMALAPNLWWLVVGRLLSGVMGASITTAGAYVADVTAPEKRAAAYGLLGAAFGIGFVIGPALGGVLGGISPRAPFWVAAALSLVNAVYGLLLLPESLPRERRAPFSFRRANPIGAFKLLRSHRELLGLASVNALQFLAFQVLPSVYVLSAGYRFGWGPLAVGLALALVGVLGIVIQGFLIRSITARVGERGALLLGLAGAIAGMLTWGFAPNGVVYFLGILPGSLGGLVGPSIQSLMSQRVGPHEQGQLQGANTSTMGLTGIVGPLVFTFVFAQSAASFAGAAFLLGAIVYVAAAAIAVRVAPRHERPAGTGAPAAVL